MSAIRTFHYLLLVSAYVLSGKAALLLALPPGYASAIFPPAGIAVAAVFIAGRRMLPAVFIGSLLLNVWVGYSASHQLDPAGVLSALIIAIASALQAGAGGWMLRRAIGYPAAFDNARDLFRFLVLTPLICVISASLSVAGLWMQGIFTTDSLASDWLTWWIGDSLGVLVLLPVTMVFAGKPRILWQSRLGTVAAPMALILALLVVTYLKANQWEQDEVLTEFRGMSQQSLGQIQIRLEELDSVLQGMRGLYLHDPKGRITRAEFHRFTAGILARYPTIQALEWAPRISSAQRAFFELEQRGESADFEIRERASDGELHRAGKRGEFYPVTYIEPLSGNEPAIGFDLASHPSRATALDKSISRGLPVATSPLMLVQAADRQAGILLIQAVELDGGRAGAVLAVLRMRDLLDRILPPASTELRIRLIDADEQSVIYDTLTPARSDALFEGTFEFGTRNYRFQTAPSEAYFKRHREWQSWGVLSMGVFGTGLLGALLLLGTGYTARVVAQVEERTKELKESETRFRSMADSAPVFIWLSDKNNVAIWFNHTLRRFTGRSLEQMSGSGWLEGVYPDDMHCLEAFAHHAARHEPFQMEFRLRRYDGEYRWILDCAQPRFDAAGNFVGYIGSGIDITERKQAAELMQHMAHYDTLTDLPNRAMFSDRLQQALAVAKRDRSRLALMFIDLDNFKPINDELGHQVGDVLLKEVAERMQRCVRESDTVARIGGDEFVVLLPVIQEDSDALLVAEKIRHALNQPFMLAGQTLHISSSTGIAIYPDHGSDDKTLVKHADIAMYNAKKSGRNNVKLFQPGMHDGDED